MRRMLMLALVAVAAGALLGAALMMPAARPADAPETDFSLGAAALETPARSEGGPRATEPFGPTSGTLGPHAGLCTDPVGFCQNVVGIQYTDVHLGSAPGARHITLRLDWTPRPVPATPATGQLQVRIIACTGGGGACGSNPPVLARATSNLDPSVNGGDHTLKLDADLSAPFSGEGLYARISTDTAGRPAESTPHASADQSFKVSGEIVRG